MAHCVNWMGPTEVEIERERETDDVTYKRWRGGGMSCKKSKHAKGLKSQKRSTGIQQTGKQRKGSVQQKLEFSRRESIEIQ